MDPSRHEASRLAQIEINAGPRVWPAVWQQTPRKAGGNLLSRGLFEVLPVPPPNVLWHRGWDVAFTAKETAKSDPDWSAGIKGGVWVRDPDYARVVISHLELERGPWPEIHGLIRRVAYSDGRGCPIGIGSGGTKPVVQGLLVDPQLMGYSLRAIPETTDKVARAQPWIDRAQAGWFAVVAGPWNDAFFDWLEAFPYGAHDDVPDALSVLWELLFTAGDSELVAHAEIDRVTTADWDRYGAGSLGF